MDSLERRLIEMNEALLCMSRGEKPTKEMMKQAQRVLAGYSNIDTGPGNDTIVINEADKECCPGYTGSQGYTGSVGYTGSIGYTGSQGEPGPQGPKGECECEGCTAVLISQDYTASESDGYIGVNSEGPVTITLPYDFENCTTITIKLEMGAPIGTRKVTLVPVDPSTIDGEDSYVMETPYEYVTVLIRAGNWYII